MPKKKFAASPDTPIPNHLVVAGCMVFIWCSYGVLIAKGFNRRLPTSQVESLMVLSPQHLGERASS